ncbi:MAG: hypothetical protein AB1497_05550 [Bacillota bacterium]
MPNLTTLVKARNLWRKHGLLIAKICLTVRGAQKRSGRSEDEYMVTKAVPKAVKKHRARPSRYTPDSKRLSMPANVAATWGGIPSVPRATQANTHLAPTNTAPLNSTPG